MVMLITTQAIMDIFDFNILKLSYCYNVSKLPYIYFCLLTIVVTFCFCKNIGYLKVN